MANQATMSSKRSSHGSPISLKQRLASTSSSSFSVPLFRVPCRSGMCSLPIHVTSSQLIASEVFPTHVVKALLYPGPIANGLVRNLIISSWDNLLDIYNLTIVKEAPAVTDLQCLEVLAGSYFSVAGALVGILKPGRMSLFGTLLVIWGLGMYPEKASKYRSN